MTTRFTNGLTTATKGSPLGEFLLPDITKAHIFMDDFDTYTAANWTVTEVGVATQALTDGDGGLLLITNAAADNDSSFSQKVGESFLLETGKKAWFDCRFKVSDATQSEIAIGLQITDTAPLDVTDGVFFLKTDGSTAINMRVEKDDTATSTTATSVFVYYTFIRLSFYYDGKSKVEMFVNGVKEGTSVTTNLPDDEELTISYGLRNGEAVAKTMTVDYIFAAKER